LTKEGVVDIWKFFYCYNKGLVRTTLRQAVDYIDRQDAIYKGLLEIHAGHFSDRLELLRAFKKFTMPEMFGRRHEMNHAS
jgi:hypothetical protein